MVSTITGLGFVFSARHIKARLLKPALLPWFRASMNSERIRVVFQNEDDQALFLKRGLVKQERTALINGTGVDISQFAPSPEPNGRPLVLFASRMLREKGAAQFVETARTLRAQGVEARFVLVVDPTRAIHAPSQRKGSRPGPGRGRGVVGNPGGHAPGPGRFRPGLFPSHYGEGVPRILVEAAASSRAVVSFDAPGCRR